MASQEKPDRNGVDHVTIDEIAKRAGVSKTAVSRYLNNGYVSQEKKERIRAVIEETGYTPSRRAQDLRRGTSRTIGVILPQIDSEPIGRVVAGISQVLEEKGFQLLLANTHNSPERELSYLDYFKNDQVDGILFIASRLTPRHRQAIADGAVPVVVIGQKTDCAACVYHDEYASAHELAGLLLRSGRRKIGMLSVVQRDATDGTERIRGFCDALRQGGVSEETSWIVRAGFDMEGGYQACQALLREHPDVEALLCATDAAAVGALKCLREQGRRVPEDVAVAGISHGRLTELITPRLTTVHYYYKTSGAEAARMLLHILDTGVDAREQLRLGYRIVEQETTGQTDGDADTAS